MPLGSGGRAGALERLRRARPAPAPVPPAVFLLSLPLSPPCPPRLVWGPGRVQGRGGPWCGAEG